MKKNADTRHEGGIIHSYMECTAAVPVKLSLFPSPHLELLRPLLSDESSIIRLVNCTGETGYGNYNLPKNMPVRCVWWVQKKSTSG